MACLSIVVLHDMYNCGIEIASYDAIKVDDAEKRHYPDGSCSSASLASDDNSL